MSDPTGQRVRALRKAAAAQPEGRIDDAERFCLRALAADASEPLAARLLATLRSRQGDDALAGGEKAPAGWGECSDAPVFVVGMPRSSTTLVEQILASHPSVHDIGEFDALGAVERRLGETDPYGDWPEDGCRREAAAYLARLHARAPDAPRIVDKTPDNLFHLGLAAMLFPGARVILCARDPRDVCLSGHFQHFSGPIAFARDLGDCARRQQAATRPAAHWREVLPLPIHVVTYESLVAGPAPEIQRMLAFLGLDWDPACLSFHLSGHPVETSSLWQVRRPLYTDASGRWRRYAAQLGPLLQAFGTD